jgi:hypothetical protein
LCRFILTEEPNRHNANHNLGVFVKQCDKGDITLPFFKTALASNPNQCQLWISYIVTLIYLQYYDTAYNALNQGQSKRLKSDGVDQLKEHLNLKVNPISEPVDSESKTLTVNASLVCAKSHCNGLMI